MQVIVSHVNTDFDALASLYAAKKLYPDATVVLSDKQETKVKQFLNIYRDTLVFTYDKDIDWGKVSELIIVDVASAKRIGPFIESLDLQHVPITIYDHHPPKEGDMEPNYRYVEQVGATVTLLLELIQEQHIELTPFEATLFGLGIYTDTNFFINDITTARDFKITGFLMENGMSLEMVQQFSEHTLLPAQQQILNDLFTSMDVQTYDGLEVVITSASYDYFQSGLATITSRLLDITNTDAVITVVGMKNHVYVVGRASSDRINLLPLLKQFKGGGHEKAGSAMVKRTTCEEVLPLVLEKVHIVAKPGIIARDIMVSPVKTLSPETTIEEAGKRMYRYGHSGYPVVDEGKLVGMVTRRDLDKANHHGLGHAPVKAYMSTNLITIPEDKTLEEIQQLIIDRNIGRVPVVKEGTLVGIVTRTDIIEKMHALVLMEEGHDASLKTDMATTLQTELEKSAYMLLEKIRKTATKENTNVYLVGGIVRDLFLHVPNDDIDIVIEGNGIEFARYLQKDYGGNVVVHESFGTATWETVDGFSIDVTTSRLEYYDRPASLPDVESSDLMEDLQRRDFTINAMAVCLTGERFGELIDPYNGQQDLRDGHVTILHNLSFVEDPTRILRAVRFEARFDFLMDEQTEQLALQSISNVKDLSNQRIVDELKRIFQEKNVGRAMMRLYDVSFWNEYGIEADTLKHSMEKVKKLTSLFSLYEHISPNWFYYIALPLYDYGFSNEINRFALTKKETKFIRAVEEFTSTKSWQSLKRSGDIHRYAKPFSDDVILFVLAVEDIANEDVLIQYVRNRKKLEQYLTGADLILHGLKPGAHFSELLLQLEIATLNKEVTTKEEAFAWLDAHKEG